MLVNVHEAKTQLSKLLERVAAGDVDGDRFRPLSISLAHAHAAGSLPLLHRDPFDRMLIAQSRLEDLTIVTRDGRNGQYGVPTLTA